MIPFDDFFYRTTENAPFPFQRAWALAPSLPQFIRVPTGLGKTATIIVGWLWRRFAADEHLRAHTPIRLVYCLPMRVLVEQTARSAQQWIQNVVALGLLAKESRLPVHVLMGGEDEEDWDLCPEQEQVLIGTQDMLLSRALNRGYATSRARWPMHFGLLHTDCLWVFDEVQLMGPGLATSTQLEAFRRILPSGDSDERHRRHGSRSVWMSATMQREWLNTVDFAPFVAREWSPDALEFDFQTEITAAGSNEKVRKDVESRWTARKPITKAGTRGGDLKGLAHEILDQHKSGTRTIVVLNTVGRARELFKELTVRIGVSQKGKRKSSADKSHLMSGAKLILLHSRFRPPDREAGVREALAEIDPQGSGTIVVSTQVIEAGVDVSATTLFSELAPWASLVQRFGRCNRRGLENESARVFWIDLTDSEVGADKLARPYDRSELESSARLLMHQTDVGLKSLPDDIKLPFEQIQVIRRKDLTDLFDTTPDLAGNDVDIDRFIRDIEDSDVRVFWREWDQTQREAPPEHEPAPTRAELCPVPIGEFRTFADDKSNRGKVWRWNFLDKRWERADSANIFPGQVFIVHAEAGGYSPQLGWDSTSRPVQPLSPSREQPDAYDDDPLSRIGVWQTMPEHVDQVCAELEMILSVIRLSDSEKQAMRYAARWHDRGKAHSVFQSALPDSCPDRTKIWAKAKGKWKRYSRPHFRHELASALAVLDPRNDWIRDESHAFSLRDLIAYLAAAHHGRVRLSIRSLPRETHPERRNTEEAKPRRFARGIWDGDELPETQLGGGVTAPRVRLSIELMELGVCIEPPFAGQPSWTERMIRMRDNLGVFRLGYMEALVRAADMRASRAAEQSEAEKLKHNNTAKDQ